MTRAYLTACYTIAALAAAFGVSFFLLDLYSRS